MLTHKLGEIYSMVSSHHLRRLLGNHDRRRVRIAANHVGHDTRVRHTLATLPHTPNPQSRIDPAADPAGAVVDRGFGIGGRRLRANISVNILPNAERFSTRNRIRDLDAA